MEETHDFSDSGRDESAIKFETYRNYLARISEFLDDEYGSWSDFVDRCYLKTRGLQPRAVVSRAWVERFLKIAWNTETLLNEQSDDPELIRINNQWLPIQAYYAVYAAAEAAVAAIEGECANGHVKCLTQITNYFVNSGLPPWNYAYNGACGRDGRQHRPVNFAPEVRPVHNLRLVGVRPVDLIATCLRAEHKHRIREGYQRGRVRKYAYNPGNTGLMHFLYRLRCKSNYRDVEAFIADAPISSVIEFSESLRRFTMWCLTYLEILFIRKCRRSILQGIATDFVQCNRRTKALQTRLSYYGSKS